MTILTPSIEFDPSGEAGELSAEAERALALGETRLARNLHLKAGKKLQDDVVNHRKQSEKSIVRFLAATQYYLGGHYALAKALCRQIKVDLLPSEMREIYAKFQRDVDERAKPEYRNRIQARITEYRKRGEYRQILDLLKEHQFSGPISRQP